MSKNVMMRKVNFHTVYNTVVGSRSGRFKGGQIRSTVQN
jgi:hypothetical protein